MSLTESATAIVVGIDGSDAAVRAAEWAVNEAIGRGLALRLVHVIEPGSEAVRLEDEYARLALDAALRAVAAICPDVVVEAAVRRGGIDAVLVEESRCAAMICIGSPGDQDAWEGSADDETTAATLTRSAGCPVAIVGVADCADYEDVAAAARCVAVVVDEASECEPLLMHAFTEAELRGCAVLLVQRRRSVSSQHRLDAFERLVNRMRADHPDVEVHLAAVGTDVAAFLAAITASVAVTIVDGVGGPARPRQRDAFPPHARWIGVQSLSAESCATVG